MLFGHQRLKSISLILFCFILLATLCATLPVKRIFISKECRNDSCLLSALLAREFNQTTFSFGKSYTLYTAGFDKEDHVPTPRTANTPILWLGGYHTVEIDKLRQFDLIFTTTPLLRNTLKRENLNVFYLPLFGYPAPESTEDTSEKVIALINNPQKIEKILQKNHLPYRRYTTKDIPAILSEMKNFRLAFIKDTEFFENSLDLNPVFFTLAEQKIPLACAWSWPQKEENINLFNDMINFYITDSEITDILAPSSAHRQKMFERATDAYALTSSAHSLKSVTARLKYTLKHHQEPKEEIAENSLNFDLPVSVGHTVSGDYTLAKHLETKLNKDGYHTSYSFYNSFYKYPAETDIIIRGTIDNNYNKTDKNQILYLAYPQFEGDGARTELETDYYQNLLPKLKDFDAIATASESLAENLRKEGLNAYYIPQFTDTEKFFPAPDKALKSEVLFVGRFAEYRRAPQAVINAGLPITIYGPDWQGFAKADALDYNLLNRYYSSAKIVLNDTRPEMLLHGVISNRIFDATASGALVISDYIPEIEKIYGDTVPMWKTEAELIELVKYYLAPEHEAERLDKARRAREITLKNFTADIAAEKFRNIIRSVKQQKAAK